MKRTELCSSWLPSPLLRLSMAAACLALAAAWSPAAGAQSCPGGYSACDNGGCCLSSDQCCPMLEEGCCSPHTPFCCGDGTCAAAPSECGNVPRNSCVDYDVPCGGGCAPAGSHCCDVLGHYCSPQGICTSETTCLAGNDAVPAEQVVASAAPPPSGTAERALSPLVDPPDGTERSCSFTPGGAATGSGALSLALSAVLVGLRRRRGARR